MLEFELARSEIMTLNLRVACCVVEVGTLSMALCYTTLETRSQSNSTVRKVGGALAVGIGMSCELSVAREVQRVSCHNAMFSFIVRSNMLFFK